MINASSSDNTVRMGLPMWFMPAWRGGLLESQRVSANALTDYAQVFGSVEGNTTFYGLPDPDRVALWWQQVPDDFRFCFKIPKNISHCRDPSRSLASHDGKALEHFLTVIAAQGADKLGVLMLQLPERLSMTSELTLMRTLDSLAILAESTLGTTWSGGIAVECRHSSFFLKDEHESRFLRALADRGMDRVIFDSRGLQADQSTTEAVLDARSKKPNLPIHAVATGNTPVVRFIGHSNYDDNRRYVMQWKSKLAEWASAGKTPYIFWHTAGNLDVPGFHRWVMETFWQQSTPWPGEKESERNLSLW